MTTLIEDTTAMLQTLGAAGGVWYGFNEAQPPVYPYIVWQCVVSPTNMTLSGPSDLQNTRVQVDIFGRRIADVVALDAALTAALKTWPVTNVPVSSQDFPEPDVRAYRRSRDISIWAKN